MYNVLFPFILPSMHRPGDPSLYYHTDTLEAVSSADGVAILKGQTLTLDSYFNAFFYSKYLLYTEVRRVTCMLCFTGRAVVRLVCLQESGERMILSELEVDGCQQGWSFPAVNLAELPQNGMIFPELCAQTEMVQLLGGAYQTELPPVQEVKVAAVICTYHREKYVQRNVELVKKMIWENRQCPCSEHLDLLVVDNAGGLQLEQHRNLKVFRNKNCGGSGGFTRGLIEAYREKERYTHVLFMDDDICFESVVLVKTVQFLRYAKRLDRPLCIGGQMLIEDMPCIQFESGAFYRKGRLEGVNKGLNVSSALALLENSKEHHVMYNAWWYCCFPLNVVDRIGLPLPLFIKTDDVEYGLRMNGDIVLMNGIGVWHQSFQEKYSPHLEYYIKRNELIVSALHHNGDGAFNAAWKLIRSAARAVLIGNPKVVDYILRAGYDFLKGPDFLLNTDDEQLNTQLMQYRSIPGKGRLCSLLTDPFRVCSIVVRIFLCYRHIQSEYIDRMGELTSISFWMKHLEMQVIGEGEKGHEAL